MGLLYVHCARAFTPLNTQRHGTSYQLVAGVGTYGPVQRTETENTVLGWLETGSERERERERWPTTPKMGYLPLPTLCTMNPAFDSATVDVLCFVASLVARRDSLSPLSKNFSEFRHGPRLRIISLDRVASFSTWIVYTMCNFRDGRCRHAKDYGWECCLRATDVGCRSG